MTEPLLCGIITEKKRKAGVFMLLFYIRHGHPIYNPDQLIPLGHKEAEAVAKRLALFGVDKIYASTSTRAMQTAQPTCDLLRKEMVTLPFAHENLAWAQLTLPLEDGRNTWVWEHSEGRKLFVSPEVTSLGHRWYDHPAFAGNPFREGVERVNSESDSFLASLGYERQADGTYKEVTPNNDRVALFAHDGFGKAFLSHILNLPLPQFAVHFDMSHTGLTAIEFSERDGTVIPRICTYSSDAHLYREGLPTEYNFRFRY